MDDYLPICIDSKKDPRIIIFSKGSNYSTCKMRALEILIIFAKIKSKFMGWDISHAWKVSFFIFFFLDDFDCVLSFLCFVAQGTVSLLQISHVIETERVSVIFIFSLDKTHFSSLFISLLCDFYISFTYRMLTKVSFKFMTPQSSFYNVFYLSFLGSHFFLHSK
jgi:hypothetical protein